MAAPAVLSIRPANKEDRNRLANLLHFESLVHRHLDWRRPLDWLGEEPFIVSEAAGRLDAALACPPDPPRIAWIRLFVARSRINPTRAWSVLWPAALEQLKTIETEQAAAISLGDWFRELVSKSHFEHTHDVVVLEWKADPADLQNVHSGEANHIRPIREDDLPGVFRVDAAAFPTLWQNSLAALNLAFKQSASATLIEIDGEIIAYQMTTPSSQGLHLARLATHPGMQGRGLAMSLVKNLQHELLKRRGAVLSVNTQDNNYPSLSLYNKLGFELNGERFPVYQLPLN